MPNALRTVIGISRLEMSRYENLSKSKFLIPGPAKNTTGICHSSVQFSSVQSGSVQLSSVQLSLRFLYNSLKVMAHERENVLFCQADLSLAYLSAKAGHGLRR